MTTTDAGVVSAAAARGPLAMEAAGLTKDFSLGRGQVVHAVRDVSFSLHAGAVVALVGESGSGKSTVARLLAGQERLTAGSIRLNGEPVELSSRRAFRRYKSAVQMVFQDPFASLNPVHTVRYHLARPVRLHHRASNPAEVQNEIRALLAQVRLTPADSFIGKYPHELSGGQRQRVAFARALAASPDVLLADEPVSMLDVSVKVEILRVLNECRESLGLALLYVTHDIASARWCADTISVMYAGQIVESGPAEEVTQRAKHPYTQLLIRSTPDPASGQPANGTMPQERMTQGSAPETVGCRFRANCPSAMAKCATDEPPVVQLTTDQWVRCWLYSPQDGAVVDS